METLTIICSQHSMIAGAEASSTELLVVAGARQTFIGTISSPKHETVRCVSMTIQGACDVVEARFVAMFPDHVCGENCRGWRSMKADRGSRSVQ